MTNPFYNPSGTPADGSPGNPAPVRTEFINIASGFAAIPAAIGSCILFKLKGGNMNSTADQQFVANLWTAGPYRIDQILAYNNAGNAPSTAAGGIYTRASKGGAVIIPAAETYASITGGAQIKVLDFSLGAALVEYSSAPYLSLTIGQGATCSLDFVIMGVLLP